MVFGEQAATGELRTQLQHMFGGEAAQTIEQMVLQARQREAGVTASVVGVVTLLVGASGVFNQLRQSLHKIWGYEASSTWRATIRGRIFAFIMVLGMGLLLLSMLVINTVLSAAQHRFGDFVSGPELVLKHTNTIISPLAAAVVFAIVFRYLPDTRMGWRHVVIGAVITAGLFTLGKYLLSLYLGRGTIATSYGAAGSVIVVLLWAYYSWLVVLLGAEFTQAHACVFGGRRDKRREGVCGR
jgi:membrane protein